MAKTEFHDALHDFVGRWDVSQRVWSDPQKGPQTHTGSCTCEITLDGAATIMKTEVPSSNNKGVSLITYNPAAARYELVWTDSAGEMGLYHMHGRANQVPSHARIQKEFGNSAVQQREWFSAQATPGSCTPSDLREVLPEAGMRLVEHKVSDNHWVLEFFVLQSGKPDVLVMENVFTRKK